MLKRTTMRQLSPSLLGCVLRHVQIGFSPMKRFILPWNLSILGYIFLVLIQRPRESPSWSKLQAPDQETGPARNDAWLWRSASRGHLNYHLHLRLFPRCASHGRDIIDTRVGVTRFSPPNKMVALLACDLKEKHAIDITEETLPTVDTQYLVWCFLLGIYKIPGRPERGHSLTDPDIFERLGLVDIGSADYTDASMFKGWEERTITVV